MSESHAGAVQVEGAWYCPAMPQASLDATVDFRVKKSIDEATWKQRIGQRRSYLLRLKESPDTDGHVPMRCPASGPSATVVCPLKNSTGDSSGCTRIPVKPSHLDRIFKNRSSVSFPPSAGAKYAQDFHYGGAEWQAMYSTARNTIEGFNGYVKDSNYEALDQPGRRRIRGYTAQYLLTTVLVVSANIRKIRTFLANVGSENEARQVKWKRQPRRRDRLANYKPASVSVSSGDPPTG